MIIYKKGKYTDFKFASGSTGLIGNTFHPHYEILLVINGEIEYISPYERQILRPYSLVVLKPGIYHHFKPYTEIENYERCVINIEQDFWLKSGINENFLGNRIYLLDKENRIVKNFLHLKTCASFLSDDDFFNVLSAVVIDSVISIKYCTETQHKDSKGIDPLALKAMQYIDTHFSESFNLNFLAKRLYCSISLISHRFKESYGISIKQYVLEKRMNKAHLDILNGEKAENVSIKYGFNCYSSFYRAYKKHFGTSPSKSTPNIY